jgi:hypothetical protein
MLLVLLFGGVGLASAQSVSAYFGLGGATDKSNGQDISSPGRYRALVGFQ